MPRADFVFDRCPIATVVRDEIHPLEPDTRLFSLSDQEDERLKRSMLLHGSTSCGGATSQPPTCACMRPGAFYEASPSIPLYRRVVVTQTPNYASPSTAIRLQHDLGMRVESAGLVSALAAAGFIYGLSTALGYGQAGYERALLGVGDVASRMAPADDHTVTR